MMNNGFGGGLSTMTRAMGMAKRFAPHSGGSGGIAGGGMHTPKLPNLGIAHFDMGGTVDPSSGGIGGFSPSAQTQNPAMQGVIQRYASLPTEKLQELAARMQGTPYAPVIQKILQQKQTQPNSQGASPVAQATNGSLAATTFNPVMNAAPPVAAQRRGGATPQRRADGGMSPSAEVPWWTRSDSSDINHGLVSGSSLGRADAVSTSAPAGAYIIPADVVAGLGDGNNLAGAKVIDEAIRTGPGGTAPVATRHGSGPPRPPAPARDARGGGVQRSTPTGRVPVLLSSGEFVVHPDIVRRIGNGNLKAGHRTLDAFVLHQRAKHIKKLKSLAPPVGAKK